ncbi:MAG: sigma-70 family RNA polymerase sigma factor [Candidatus Hydrogenedentota bacterium]
MEIEDAEYVARCLTGDTQAYTGLVKRYERSVYANAYYYVGRYGASEDVAQDAFLSAYRNLPRLDDHSKFAPWLKEITCRTASNWLRRHDKKLKNETPLPYKRTIAFEDARDIPGKSLEREERMQQIERAIDTLPERYRLPVVLRYVQELSYKEIATYMGLEHTRVRGILERATRQLRQILSDSDEQQHGESHWPRAQR